MNSAQEVACGFVVARGDGAVLLEPGEEVLDQMASLVQMAVVGTLLLACADRRNHHRLAGLAQRLDHAGLRVIGLVGDDGGGLGARQQRIGAFEIVGLPGREMKSGRIAQRIDRGVNLRAQPASAAPDGFLLSPFFAPALCWWARTMVLSIIAYSLSASCAKASKMRCHTPCRESA